MKKLNGRAIAVSAMIAAVYTAVSWLCRCLLRRGADSSGGMSDPVTVLSPLGIYGVTVGCLLTNLVGAVMGLTMPVDILFGTLLPPLRRH